MKLKAVEIARLFAICHCVLFIVNKLLRLQPKYLYSFTYLSECHMAETALRDPLNLIRLIPAKGTRDYLYCISLLRSTVRI